jgi:hypothetical protein
VPKDEVLYPEEIYAARRKLPLRGRPIPRRVAGALPVSALLLLHLPQDGGYAINLGALSDTLEVAGEESISVYQARIDGGPSPAQRRFCRNCGSALWVFDPRWPELVHPFASAIDTLLPKPPERVHIMLDYAASWCEVPSGENDKHFPEGPDESLADWHLRHGLRDESQTD